MWLGKTAPDMILRPIGRDLLQLQLKMNALKLQYTDSLGFYCRFIAEWEEVVASGEFGKVGDGTDSSAAR